MTARCPLCAGPGPLTKEDLVPSWIRRDVLRRYRLAQGDIPRRFVLRICATCNGNLGRCFEDPAAPILKKLIAGRSLSLELPEQQVVSRWIAKTTLIGLLKTTSPGLPHEALTKLLRRVIDQQVPPTGSCIRLFQVVPDNSASSVPEQTLTGGELPRPLSVFGVSYFGKFGYEMVCGLEETILAYALRTRRSSLSVTVWPMSRTPVLWPPATAIRGTDLLALRQAHGSTRDDGVPSPFDYSWVVRPERTDDGGSMSGAKTRS